MTGPRSVSASTLVPSDWDVYVGNSRSRKRNVGVSFVGCKHAACRRMQPTNATQGRSLCSPGSLPRSSSFWPLGRNNAIPPNLSPDDIAYIFAGYAPLSIRLVQHAVRSGWRSIEELLKLLPGPHMDLKRGVSTINSSELLPGSGSQQSTDRVGHRSLVLVVFIGGVTSAEIAALRFLSAQEGMGYDFLVATTKVITGNTLLRPIIASSKEGMI
ncbi:Vacuolar protein sorting-associated protein 33-like protein [Triticum urartu]|uniref:Vacuolar protein sorting-associated protein 33-like protein n=1 Tax=Triticum urartu TaxID=4572 RepID=M7YPF6_TRIUA|nr:Vacuolar protein sorting-associated protein 33-like protein [Triticum urartu]